MPSNQQQQSMPPPPLVWFQLLESDTGEPYKGTAVSSILRSSIAVPVVDQFRKAVHLKNSSILTGITSSQLIVYKNKTALDKKNVAVGKGNEEPLEEDSFINGLGETEEKALIVLVPSSACSLLSGDNIESDASSRPFTRIEFNGIDLEGEYLKRNELVEKLHYLVSSSCIVLISTPAGSGKTCLFQLYKSATKNIEFVYISFLDNRTPFAILSDAGIDLGNMTISENLVKKDVVVFLDDAQEKYDDDSFWVILVKVSRITMPKNIRFIISANYSLPGSKESPIEFNSLPRLTRKDFVLTEGEAYQLLEFRDFGFPANSRQHKILKHVIVKECGGLVGALRLSVEALKREFFSSQNDDVEEALCLQYYLSGSIVQNMACCFGSAHSYPAGNESRGVLKMCFENNRIRRDSFTNPQDDDSHFSLMKAGILVEYSGCFSSPLAKRYYFNWMFPNRSVTSPSSLRELVRKVISNMSSTALKNSTLSGDFPNEADFQHLFMEGLALNTPPDCSICPELSKIFPLDTALNTQKANGGEIDFFLNGSLRWGIELLVNGNDIGENLGRFSWPNGKYASLAVDDYVIVDFRRNTTGQPTDISKHPNRVSVFFNNDDYTVAQCLFGEDTAAIGISLAN